MVSSIKPSMYNWGCLERKFAGYMEICDPYNALLGNTNGEVQEESDISPAPPLRAPWAGLGENKTQIKGESMCHISPNIIISGPLLKLC